MNPKIDDVRPDLEKSSGPQIGPLFKSPYFRLGASASGPRTGFPGPVWGRCWPEAKCGRTKNRSDMDWAEGPAPLGPVFGPFALGLRQKPAPEARSGNRKHYCVTQSGVTSPSSGHEHSRARASFFGCQAAVPTEKQCRAANLAPQRSSGSYFKIRAGPGWKSSASGSKRPLSFSQNPLEKGGAPTLSSGRLGGKRPF